MNNQTANRKGDDRTEAFDPTERLFGEDSPKRRKNRRKPPDTEALLALLLLAVCLFSILFVAVFSQSASRERPSDPPESSSPEGTTPIDPDDPPVFAGASLPSRPSADASTATLTNGIYSGNATLVDLSTGKILAAKNADERFSPASMTKIMTLIVACERLKQSDLSVRIEQTTEINAYVSSGKYYGADTATVNGTLYVGDEFEIKDLLYGIGVASAAECTMMVASYLCPADTPAESEAKFVDLMNQKAAELGLVDTHFDNAAGVESEGTYSTANEMAMILSYASQCDLIAKILGTESVKIYSHYIKDGEEKTVGFTLNSHLFVQRMNAYKNKSGQDFKLETSKLLFGKTGYITNVSNVALCAEGKTSGARYALVTGCTSVIAWTMYDVKTILDAYVS